MSHQPHHHHRAGTAKGGFWLAAAAAALVLSAGPGRAAGLWGARVEEFLLRWAAYQGVFAGCFGVGVILADMRKTVVRWALPAVAIGLLAALLSGSVPGVGR
ncbi:MAG: hypothetical protein HY077_14640 [Elusimicrobia bacterium]|nr:hypothetical protein [Elusimicrobiota bacterium]